jgi:hypothetical protein
MTLIEGTAQPMAELSESQKFDAALGKILSVSHDELKRREKKWKRHQKAKKQAKAKP